MSGLGSLQNMRPQPGKLCWDLETEAGVSREVAPHQALPMTASTAPFSACQPRWVPSSPASPWDLHTVSMAQPELQRWGLFSHLASPEQDPRVPG